jgi:hypothetical protein
VSGLFIDSIDSLDHGEWAINKLNRLVRPGEWASRLVIDSIDSLDQVSRLEVNKLLYDLIRPRSKI